MKNKTDIVSVVFWILIVFYLDPGGYMDSYLSPKLQTVVLFGITALAWLCFGARYHKNENLMINGKLLSSYYVFIAVWLLYYFLWYYGFNNPFYEGFIKSIARNDRVLNLPLLVLPITFFASIDLTIFTRILTWSTIVILFLMVLSVFSGIHIVPYWEVYRSGVSSMTRFLMHREGIVYLLLPMAISMLLLKFRIDNRIISGGIFVVIYIFLLSIFRRNMIGIIEYTIILSFMVNYIFRRNPFSALKRVINFKSVLITVLLIVIIAISFPKFVTSFQTLVQSTYESAILGKEQDGTKDNRLSLTANTAIILAISNNFLGGTGFHPDWLVGDGGKNKWEGADYMFLAAFAMYGLTGLLIFLIFYIIAVKIIIEFLRLLKEYIYLIAENEYQFYFPVIIGLSCSAELIKNIIEYPNWFHPIITLDSSGTYFIYFGLLLGSYYQIQKKIILIKVSDNED